MISLYHYDSSDITEDMASCACAYPKHDPVNRTCAECYWSSVIQDSEVVDGSVASISVYTADFDRVCMVGGIRNIKATRSKAPACEDVCSISAGLAHEKHVRVCAARHAFTSLVNADRQKCKDEESDRTSW